MPKDSKINKKKPPLGKKPASRKGKPGQKDKRTKARAEFHAKQTTQNKQKAELWIPVDDNAEIQRGLYSDEILPKVELLASKGLNNAQIAEALCIGNRTFYDWRQMYPQFLHALNKYRGVADIQVENALFANATGYAYKEQVATPSGKRLTVQKWHAGNATAQIFYLKNRMPDRYRDKVEIGHSLGAGMEQITFSLVPREE